MKTDMNIDLSKPVKLRNPEPGEENIVFMVVNGLANVLMHHNYNESTQRCYIEAQVDMMVKPQELVSITEIKNV